MKLKELKKHYEGIYSNIYSNKLCICTVCIVDNRNQMQALKFSVLFKIGDTEIVIDFCMAKYYKNKRNHYNVLMLQDLSTCIVATCGSTSCNTHYYDKI